MTTKTGVCAGRRFLITGAVLLLCAVLVSALASAAAGVGDGGNGTAAIWGPYLTAMDMDSVQVRWHGDGVTGVLFRPAGGGVWEAVPSVHAGEGFWYAELSNLSPSSSYEYRLAGGDGGPYLFTTFPADGPVTFAVIGDTQDDPTLPVPDGRTSLVAEAIATEEECMFLLHLGDTVGDPFKDTSSVALNPVIKFTTLFGLLAVELGVYLAAEKGSMLLHLLAGAFFLVSVVFVYRSFYGMRIETQ